MTRFTLLFPLAALVISLSVSHTAMANGVLFPSLQFPKDGTFTILKPKQGGRDE